MRKTKLISLLLSVLLVLVMIVGCTTTSAPQPETPPETEPVEEEKSEEPIVEEYDVVVVGGGAAGLAASIEAAEAGAKVALVEKLSFVGGSTILSGGIVYGTGSDMQKEAGIEDSVEELVQYWSDRADGLNDKEFLTFVAERSGGTINWLVDLGVEFAGPTPAGTSPVPRAHNCTTQGTGLVKPLEAHAKLKGVEIFLETKAEKLITNDNNEVIGIVAVDKDQKEITFNSKAVILATGGFDRNIDLVKKYAPVEEGHATFVGAGNTGDGLKMALDVNADIVGNGGVIGFRTVEGEPAYTTDVCLLMWMPYLYVNLDGQRFLNETLDYPLFYEELIKQREQVSYLIFDGNTYTEALDKAVEKGVAFVSETLEDLAEQAGINAENFVATVENYNKMIENGKDTEFGKDLTGHKAINTAKYYALKVVPATLGTLSGIKVNLDSQVIDTDGNVIPGLYAAGEVANGMFFNKVYPASGTSIQMCLTFGRVAGQNAAMYAGK